MSRSHLAWRLPRQSMCLLHNSATDFYYLIRVQRFTDNKTVFSIRSGIKNPVATVSVSWYTNKRTVLDSIYCSPRGTNLMYWPAASIGMIHCCATRIDMICYTTAGNLYSGTQHGAICGLYCKKPFVVRQHCKLTIDVPLYCMCRTCTL